MEILLAILAFVLVVGLLVSIPTALILTFMNSSALKRLRERLDALESRLSSVAPAPSRQEEPAAEPSDAAVDATVVDEPAPAEHPTDARERFQWELFIGRKAFGWVAVVLVLFGTGFFLKFAFENQWIGPVGRISIGLIAGVGLIVAGWRYARKQWRVFSQMLTTAGVLLLYLSTYSAFGFYQLLPQYQAGLFLLVIIIEAALLAVIYDAPALAYMSLIGGLITPLIMYSEVDQYKALFAYLAALDVGVVLLALWKRWRGLGSVALIGTHILFWIWYTDNFHHEKLVWAMGFQAVTFGLFIVHTLFAHVLRPRRANWDDLVRLLLNAFLWFAAAYILLNDDYGDWMGTLAIAMAVLYVLLGRIMLAKRPEDLRQLTTSLAAATGFIALAIPIQADADWVALGWAAEAAALWWFGLRIRTGTLRLMAVCLGAMAVFHLVFINHPRHDDFLPVFNVYALPGLSVAACVILSAIAGRRYRDTLPALERPLVAVLGVTGLSLLLWVLSADLMAFFNYLARTNADEFTRWRWFGQVALSALWSIYASVLLAVGFLRRLPLLRWLAIVLFFVTIGKVFVFDMANLREFYRIIAFFVLALLLGIAGWAYQQFRDDPQPSEAANHE